MVLKTCNFKIPGGLNLCAIPWISKLGCVEPRPKTTVSIHVFGHSMKYQFTFSALNKDQKLFSRGCPFQFQATSEFFPSANDVILTIIRKLFLGSSEVLNAF